MACSEAYSSANSIAASRRSASSIAACTVRSSTSPSRTNSMAGRSLAATSCSTWAIFNPVGRSIAPRSGGRAEPRVMGDAVLLRGENGEQLPGLHGIPDQPPLRIIAAVPAQELELIARLDTLCDDFEIEALAHVDDGAHDGGVVRVDGHIAHEGLVDLQRSDGELLQGRQRREARADISNGQIQTRGVHLVQQ